MAGGDDYGGLGECRRIRARAEAASRPKKGSLSTSPPLGSFQPRTAEPLLAFFQLNYASRTQTNFLLNPAGGPTRLCSSLPPPQPSSSSRARPSPPAKPSPQPQRPLQPSPSPSSSHSPSPPHPGPPSPALQQLTPLPSRSVPPRLSSSVEMPREIQRSSYRAGTTVYGASSTPLGRTKGVEVDSR